MLLQGNEFRKLESRHLDGLAMKNEILIVRLD